MADRDQISELASRISCNTEQIKTYLAERKLPMPSFSATGPLSSPIPEDAPHIIAAREAVIEDTLTLNQLMRGPTEHLMALAATSPHDCLSLQAMHRWRLFDKFEPGSDTTFEALADASQVNLRDLKRFMRAAMANRIFEEHEGGKVTHTAASRALREIPVIRNIVGTLTEEMFPSSAKTLDALEMFNGSHASNQCGFALANNPARGLYEEFSTYPERGQRYAAAMSGFAARTNVDALAKSHDWPKCASVVDVGGGWGPVSIALGEKFPGPIFTVQDLPHVIAKAPHHVPPHLKDRVLFEAGDCFKPQTRTDADVYLLRHVLHNYPDESCSEILRAQAHGLSNNSCIIVYDAVRPEQEPKLRFHQEKMKRSMDLTMLTFFGARERTLKEWQSIVAAAHPGLEIKFRNEFPGAEDNVLRIAWREKRPATI